MRYGFTISVTTIMSTVSGKRHRPPSRYLIYEVDHHHNINNSHRVKAKECLAYEMSHLQWYDCTVDAHLL